MKLFLLECKYYDDRVMNMVADPELPASWRKNFYDPLARVFYDGTEFSMTMPFMALYIETFASLWKI